MVLEGNLHACLDYSAVTGGKGFEDAYADLRPQLMTYEDEGVDELNRVHPFKDPEPWACLLWGLSASWRSDEGWNDSHSFGSDIGVTVRESKRFAEFVKAITFDEYRSARPILLELLLLTLYVPAPSPSKKKAVRSTKRSKKTPTGTSTT